jgi:hypothetical protein
VLFTDAQMRQLLAAAARLNEGPGFTALAAATYRIVSPSSTALAFASGRSPVFSLATLT